MRNVWGTLAIHTCRQCAGGNTGQPEEHPRHAQQRYILLSIVFTTYARTEYATRTIGSILSNLTYAGLPADRNPDICWFVVDDGSQQSHLDAIESALSGQNVGYFLSQRRGYGANVNDAWRRSWETSSVSLLLEDDWELRQALDVTPYVRLLEYNTLVGMVRLGYLPVGLRLNSVGHEGRMYLQVEPETQYFFSGNPHLKHRRFGEQYGFYPEGKNPGDTELAYDWQCRERANSQTQTPRIWWPLAIGDVHLFGHIGTEKSY